MTRPKQKFGYIFKCPETGCKKKPFNSLNGLHVHLKKSHNVTYKFDLDAKGRACYRANTKARVALVI